MASVQPNSFTLLRTCGCGAGTCWPRATVLLFFCFFSWTRNFLVKTPSICSCWIGDEQQTAVNRYQKRHAGHTGEVNIVGERKVLLAMRPGPCTGASSARLFNVAGSRRCVHVKSPAKAEIHDQSKRISVQNLGLRAKMQKARNLLVLCKAGSSHRALQSVGLSLEPRGLTSPEPCGLTLLLWAFLHFH